MSILSEKLTPRDPKRRRCCIITSLAVAVVVILAIVVPCAVVLSKRGSSSSPKSATVIVPLYIYPENSTTWRPLHSAIQNHPDLNFLVVLNPDSGPGNTTLSNPVYTSEIENLTSYANVQPVGYVRTGYATRNITDVLADVATYAGWASNSSGLAMHGIFFDEAPHEYSADAVAYMQTINRAVKSASGLLANKTIVHNPGVVPDSRFNDSNTDITVIFEESYDVYNTRRASVQQASDDEGRSAFSIMVHTVPVMSDGNLRDFVDQLSTLAEYLFVTTNTERYYQQFGSDWSSFISAISS